MVIKGKTIKIAVLCFFSLVLAAALFVLSINAVVKLSAKDRILSADDDRLVGYDCILVLGAGVRNGEPSDMLEDRLLVAIELYKSGEVASKLLMSGDHGKADYDEVNVMKRFAIEQGVPSEDIFMDHAGFSTYESIYRAKHIFGAKKIIIVTQEYHLYRALYVAQRLGLEAYGVSSDIREYVGETVRGTREILARNKDFFMCIFKPKPMYLGDTISLKGNGNITDG
jgi:vancomycin permeability regulator SanA